MINPIKQMGIMKINALISKLLTLIKKHPIKASPDEFLLRDMLKNENNAKMKSVRVMCEPFEI
jgi:hypothetical protein